MTQEKKLNELTKKRKLISALFEQIVEFNGDTVWLLLKQLPVCKFNGPLKKLVNEVIKTTEAQGARDE